MKLISIILIIFMIHLSLNPILILYNIDYLINNIDIKDIIVNDLSSEKDNNIDTLIHSVTNLIAIFIYLKLIDFIQTNFIKNNYNKVR